MPSPQLVQVIAPGPAYWPAPQVAHAVAPVPACAVPGWHTAHVVRPGEAEKVLTPHGVGSEDFSGQYDPAGHAVQLTDANAG